MAGRGSAAALLLLLVSTARLLLLGQPVARPPDRLGSGNAVLDPQVLETVLQDLLTYMGDDSPVTRRGFAPKQLVFSARAAVNPQDVDDVLYRHHKERWAKLAPAELAAAREAAEHLVQRIRANELFKPFRPKDERILVRGEVDDGKRRGDLFAMDARPIRAWPPGYSRDKSFSMVRLIIPWSIHHANATYLLAWRHARWVVLLRQFVYYV
jgi:hypothetical protein